MASIDETLVILRARLGKAACDAPEMEADILVAAALGVSRSRLLAQRSREISSEETAAVEAMVVRRLRREPLAYIVGFTEFYGREFETVPSVLIPRVDTEVLVDVSLSHLKSLNKKQARVLELGVGSGCVICSLLAEMPLLKGVGVDLSASALKLSAQNAEKLSVRDRLILYSGSWYEALNIAESAEEGIAEGVEESFDLIVSNPPYIKASERETLQPEVKNFEPPEALFVPGDGLENYSVILAGAQVWLCGGGSVILEMGHDQAGSLVSLARTLGYRNVETFKDSADIERVLKADRP